MLMWMELKAYKVYLIKNCFLNKAFFSQRRKKNKLTSFLSLSVVTYSKFVDFLCWQIALCYSKGLQFRAAEGPLSS